MHNPKTSFNFCSNCDLLYLIVVGLLNATLRDVMVFATVFDQVPLLGFEKQPKYEFSARNTLPTDSTCGPTLHLPLNIGLKQFTEKMTFAITYSFALGLARCKANIILMINLYLPD